MTTFLQKRTNTLITVLLIWLIGSLSMVSCKATEEEETPVVEETPAVTENNKPTAVATYTLAIGDANCPNGGIAIDTGIDENGNGVLDTDEVDNTQYVCHGTSGVNSLVNISDEAAGTNCAIGGKKIESGLDNGDNGETAGDDILQPGEVDATEYLCSSAGVNSTPVADAGIDQNLGSGSIITLDGSGSSDPDGDSLTYSWSFASKPSGSTAALSDESSVGPTFIADLDGDYVLQLIVMDFRADSTPDTVTITADASIAKALTEFKFEAGANGDLSSDVTGVVDEANHTISISVPSGTDVTALVATFTTTGSSVAVVATSQVSGTTNNDFTSPATYTVTAADSSTQNYVVTVTIALSSAKALTEFKFEASTNAALTSDAIGVIDEGNHAVAVSVPHQTDVTALVATFTTTGSSVAITATTQVSGTTANDFTIPVTYTVAAADSSTQDYTVTVTVAAGLLGQQAYIKAVNNDAGDNFGGNGYSRAVAISGDTLVVGAYREESNQTTITNGTTASDYNYWTQAGAVYVYKRSGDSWLQEAYIKAANSDRSDYFGTSVAISNDTIAVGTQHEDSNQTTITNGTTASDNDSSTASGAVYVYRRTNNAWSQEAYIKAANNDSSDQFGIDVSISGDTIVVGAIGEDSNMTTITNGGWTSSDDSNSYSGAVYVYKRTDTSWALEAYIKAANNNANDKFGNSVAIAGDTIAVGASLEDSNQIIITNGTTASDDDSNANSGAVYVYKRSGVDWSQEAFIKASNNDAGDYFGTTVAISDDTIVVAAKYEKSNQITITNGTTASDDNSYNFSGAVYVYKRTGSLWEQEAYIKSANNDEGDYFGYSVAVLGDTILVGANSEDSNQTTITNGTAASYDNSSNNSGAVYVYKRTGSNWEQAAFIKASNNGNSDSFGGSVAISDNTIVVGASYEGSNQTSITNGANASGNNDNSQSGAVYVYTLNDPSAKAIKAFTFEALYNSELIFDAVYNSGLNTDVITDIDEANHTLSVTVPWGVDPTALVATFAVTGSSVEISATAQSSGATANDFTSALTYTVTAVDGSTQDYLVTVTNAAPSSDKAFTEFKLEAANNVALSEDVTGDIDEANHTVSLTVPAGTDLTALVATFVTSGNAIEVASTTQVSGTTANDFSSPVTYTVTAQDGSTQTYIVTLTWSAGIAQQAYVKRVNNQAGGYFGGWGDQLSVSGDTMVVGVNNESSNQTTITNGTTASTDTSNSSSGAVYVYQRTGNNWAQEAYIKAANNEASDEFGASVAISGDTIAVGAAREASNQTTITNGTSTSSDNSSTSSGAVHVYKRSGTDWAQEAYIKASNNDANEDFGQSIAISGDTIAVGTCHEKSNQTTITNGTTASSDNSNSSSGAVYVYKRSGTDWAQEAYIKASNNDASDRFGISVSVSSDTIVVGATWEDSNQTTITNGTSASSDNNNPNSGAVYVYKRTGSDWSQEAYIKAVNGDADDYFGEEVAISGDTIVVGVYREDSNQTTITNGTTASDNDYWSGRPGAVYVYRRIGVVWSQEAYIKPVNNNGGNELGKSVAITDDTLVVGASGDWGNQTTITNGTTASDIHSAQSSGAAYVYKRTGSNWAQIAYIKSSNSEGEDDDFMNDYGGDHFGNTVSISDDTIIVGAYGESSNQTTISNGTTASDDNSSMNSGAVYIYKIQGDVVFE